jgi:esterase/lipase
MTFSLSGHNDSDGDIADQTRQKSLQEVLAAYDLLQVQTKNKIAVAGNSYGGYLAALLAAERSLAAVSLRVPANYPDEHFDESQLNQRGTIVDWRELPLEFNTTRSLKAIHDFAGAVQIIEAELDEMVPHQTVQNYVSAVSNKAKLDFHLMKGWPHSISGSQERAEQLQDILLHWLSQKV